MNPDLIVQQASDFIDEVIPFIRKQMADESPDDPIGVIRISEGLGPMNRDQLADLAALALRRLAGQ